MNGKEYYEFCTDYKAALIAASKNLCCGVYYNSPKKNLNKGETKLKEFLDKELKNIDFDIDDCFVEEI